MSRSRLRQQLEALALGFSLAASKDTVQEGSRMSRPRTRRARRMLLLFWVIIVCTAPAACEEYADNDAYAIQDMLTPAYYAAEPTSTLRSEINRFVHFAHRMSTNHPLSDGTGVTPAYRTPSQGEFGAHKGTEIFTQHHPAIDLYVGGRQTAVALYAAHDGRVATFRDIEKYRHLLTLTTEIRDDAGALLGRMVTFYGHIDLDLDEAAGLLMDGAIVRAGDLLSRHLYAGTMGGPHLHYEIRYYRPNDTPGTDFYGGNTGPMGNPSFTLSAAEPWPFGAWHPEHGYGFGNPANHGIED